MLLQLLSPLFTVLEIAFIIVFVAAVCTLFYITAQREKARLFPPSTPTDLSTPPPFAQTAPAASSEGGFKWRKAGPYLLLAVFVFIYPFTGPFVHFLTDLAFGVPDNPVDALGNVSGAAVAANQVAGGGVQLGTFFTKLWIAVVFYLLFSGLPWLIQQLTHPAPTAWAKASYTSDFNDLPAETKFEVYGRLQYVNTAKIVGAALAAALLV